jgi:aminoglycoside 3-N-acetyltransferase
MSQEDLMKRTPEPRTRDSLAADLAELGLRPGDTVLVHASLSALGWVNGGVVAVLGALMDRLTERGTLAMPAHSSELSDPSGWSHPPAPTEWWPLIRQTMPAYDPRRTPTYAIGRIAEAFRTWPDVVRSQHPAVSFAAWGQHRQAITAGHELDFGMGEGSPLARLYELNAKVLLLGVGYGVNSSFHLAEYRAAGARIEQQAAPIQTADGRRWQTYREIEMREDLFPAIGDDFESTHTIRRGQVGSADSRLFSQPAAVDFATGWMDRWRQANAAD